jgi:hypothetical protein
VSTERQLKNRECLGGGGRTEQHGGEGSCGGGLSKEATSSR